MGYRIKCLSTGLILFVFANQVFGQEIQVSKNLVLNRLSENCYQHTQKGNNGLVYINQGKAAIVSTPDSDIETQNLIDWVRNEQHAEIVAYVIDRWHPDAMQGLDVVKENGIKSYAYELTRQIAKEKGLPIPEIGFNPKKEIKIGDKNIVCHFLGEAHTSDGIVVWIPSEKILFGGNELRNYEGWIGNIGDAYLEEWSETVKNIKREYSSAKIVVPGHGKSGGQELIDYTISLYNLPRKKSNQYVIETDVLFDVDDSKEFNIKAKSDSIYGNKRILKNASIVVHDKSKLIVVESPQMTINQSKSKIDSETGRVRIYDKRGKDLKLRTDVDYRKLITYKYDDTIVGYVVVLKEITNNNKR